MQQKWNQNFDGELMPDIPQKFLNAGCDVYMVMQLRHDEKILDERFASMRELNRRGKTPDPEHYEVTYYADLPAMWQDVPNNEVLEELFQMFNLSRPQDFEGHSLSVSDVIALKRNGEVSVHYVDSIGFKDLQGFLELLFCQVFQGTIWSSPEGICQSVVCFRYSGRKHSGCRFYHLICHQMYERSMQGLTNRFLCCIFVSENRK